MSRIGLHSIESGEGNTIVLVHRLPGVWPGSMPIVLEYDPELLVDDIDREYYLDGAGDA